MSDAEKTSVTVRIAGEEHTIRSTAGAEYTRRCAAVVDERIREIQKKASLMEPHRTAILAALSITDECLQAREELEALRRDLSDWAGELAGHIDDRLGESEE